MGLRSTQSARTPMLPKVPPAWPAAGCVHIAEDRLPSHLAEWDGYIIQCRLGLHFLC